MLVEIRGEDMTIAETRPHPGSPASPCAPPRSSTTASGRPAPSPPRRAGAGGTRTCSTLTGSSSPPASTGDSGATDAVCPSEPAHLEEGRRSPGRRPARRGRTAPDTTRRRPRLPFSSASSSAVSGSRPTSLSRPRRSRSSAAVPSSACRSADEIRFERVFALVTTLAAAGLCGHVLLGGGTGRRAGLRRLWPQGRGGSRPL